MRLFNRQEIVEFTRFVHDLHVLLNICVTLKLAVVSVIFEVTEAMRVATNLVVFVSLCLLKVLLIEAHSARIVGSVVVVRLFEVLFDVKLLVLVNISR